MKIGIFLGFLLLFFASSTWAQRGYLNTEDDTIISVFNIPGVDWKTCANIPGCKPVGWLPNDAKVEITGEETVKMPNPYTLDIEDVKFYSVKFEYTPKGYDYKKTGTGYIDSAFVSQKPVRSFYSPQEPEKPKEPCPPQSRSSQKNPPPVLKTEEVESVASQATIMAINESADALTQVIGKCALKPANELKPETVRSWGNQISYDAAVLPILRATPVPKVIGESGMSMNRTQMIEIDALARTLYGEMANCFKSGLEYPMAVAKVALNRKDFVQERPKRTALFDRGGHAEDKGPIARIVTAKDQFSVWNKYDSKAGKFNPLQLSLCPPQSKDTPFWTGNRPPPYETAIWHNAVRIATEAVLYPRQFKNRTSQVDNYYYTSGMGKFLGMKKEHPVINGRRISSNRCVELWNGKP